MPRTIPDELSLGLHSRGLNQRLAFLNEPIALGRVSNGEQRSLGRVAVIATARDSSAYASLCLLPPHPPALSRTDFIIVQAEKIALKACHG